jgi:galactokinase
MMEPARLRERFATLFDDSPALYRAPGRVNLIGEHSDYNDGFVMPVNTALYTWVAGRPRSDRRVRVHAERFSETFEFHLDELAPAGNGHWSEYVRGVAAILQDEGYEPAGADLLIAGDVPLGGGLSSSASLEAVLAVAWLDFSGQQVNPGHVAQMCKRAENEFVGVQCGIMDQYVITGAARGRAMKLDCRSLVHEDVRLPDGLGVLVVDCGVKHSLQDGGFNQRQAECMEAARLLAASHESVRALRDATLDILDDQRSVLGEACFRRARHVVTEQQRVHAVQRAMLDDDLEAMGQLMDASHISLRDDFEVSCRELDELTEIARRCPGVYGSRMVGAGWGGCAIVLADNQDMKQVSSRVVADYSRSLGRAPWHHIVRPADPAGIHPD